MAISSSRLVVAAGNTMMPEEIYPASPSNVTEKALSYRLFINLQTGNLVFGTSSATPLVACGVTESGIRKELSEVRVEKMGRSPCPQAMLALSGKPSTTAIRRAVYSITGTAPRAFPWASSSDQITIKDPLTQSPVYSLSSAGAHIAAGSARSSVVNLYDDRSPKTGWSIYVPQEYGRLTSSPVYSCLLESTRLWAATESRPFVVDFGEVHERTFPHVTE
ncbi:hypothetical protein JB92DRAFT_2824749 [Gautieria morchelliformis]|nr:hypothetical protein JB92DRAFT_2824749 [Gautieria morchelliformis]